MLPSFPTHVSSEITTPESSITIAGLTMTCTVSKSVPGQEPKKYIASEKSTPVVKDRPVPTGVQESLYQVIVDPTSGVPVAVKIPEFPAQIVSLITDNEDPPNTADSTNPDAPEVAPFGGKEDIEDEFVVP